MEIKIANKAGKLKIKVTEDGEGFSIVEYWLDLNPNIDIGKIKSQLHDTPYNDRSFWVNNYEDRLGVMFSKNTFTSFSGHLDFVVDPTNLNGYMKEEFSNKYVEHAVSTMMTRFVILNFII